jgi:hypothetical protein
MHHFEVHSPMLDLDLCDLGLGHSTFPRFVVVRQVSGRLFLNILYMMNQN